MEYVMRASGDRIFPEGGGMLIRDKDGEIIGAVGVTGDTQERDEELASHGIRAAGLKTDADCANLGSKVTMNYRAAGFHKSDAHAMAPLVDKVLGDQMKRLRAYAATARRN